MMATQTWAKAAFAAAFVAGAALLLGVAAPASAATIAVPAVVDGTAFDQGSDGTFESVEIADPNGILSRNLGSTRTERALLEFAVAPFPGQTLSAASFSGYINLMQGLEGQPVPVAIVAYPGDGTLTTADATRGGITVATFNVTDLGAFNVPLDISAAGQLLQPATGGIVGLRVEIPGGSNGGPGIRIDSTEGFFGPPRLNLTFVPEPSSAAVVAMGLGALTLGRRRRE